MTKYLGMQLIWTMHNIQPHEQITSNDKEVARQLVESAAMVIVHKEDTVRRAINILGTTSSRCRVVPLGPYLLEGSNRPRDVVLKQFGVRPDTKILLFCGQLRRYKGIVSLVQEFIVQRDKGWSLVIAGECPDSELREEVRRLVVKESSIVHIDRFVTDTELADMLAVANYLCLPFEEVTTTSTAMLGLCNGVPLIAPRIGDLADYPPDVGIFYDPTDRKGLFMALEEGMRSQRDRVSYLTAIQKSTNGASWQVSAELTLEIYDEVLANTKRGAVR